MAEPVSTNSSRDPGLSDHSCVLALNNMFCSTVFPLVSLDDAPSTHLLRSEVSWVSWVLYFFSSMLNELLSSLKYKLLRFTYHHFSHDLPWLKQPLYFKWTATASQTICWREPLGLCYPDPSGRHLSVCSPLGQHKATLMDGITLLPCLLPIIVTTMVQGIQGLESKYMRPLLKMNDGPSSGT